MADRILLQEIEFYGHHGVPDEERAVGHRFRADVALELDLRQAGLTDDLAGTVDYGEAVRVVLEIGAGPSVRLVETLAERMAERLLDAFPALTAVEIRVAKLLPPVAATVAACAVEIRRERPSVAVMVDG